MADIVTSRSPYIDGAFVPGGGGTFAVEDPSTESAFTDVESASLEQVDDAIAAARRAFDDGPWPRMTPAERADVLGRMADALEARRDLLVETIIAEAGCPRLITQIAQVGLALQSAHEMPPMVAALPEWEHNELPLREQLQGSKLRLSIRRYEPVGVVAAITPYNFPFITNVWKVMPALATGCTVVLRPSPLTPLSALVFGEAAEEAGLPAGVLNVVAEGGAEGGQRLSSHPAVDLVSFTGSVAVGRSIATQAAATLKRVILELGGKSVQLHLPDALADGPAGAAGQAAMVFTAHAGQGCALQTRMLVPHDKKAEVLDAVGAAAERMPPADPHEASTMVGPLITEAHRARVEGLVAEGLAAGGRLVAGGHRPENLERGWYYSPTVVDIDDNANPLAQREVFGPVITVQGYTDVDEAVAIANDSEYGLSGGVYTDDLALGLSIAERIRSGTVQVNTSAATSFTPMGGYKQSGIGRERGIAGVREFQELKHIVVGSR